MKKKILITSILSILTLSGCTSMEPKYERPNIEVEKDLNTLIISDYINQDIEFFFKDSELNSLINKALLNNKDLKIAKLSAEKLKSLYQIEDSKKFPDLEAEFGYDNEGVSKNKSITGKSYTDEDYSLNVGFTNYELDLFGKNASQSNSAINEYLSSESGYKVFKISLISQIAKNYYELIYLIEEKKIKEKLVSNLLETTDVSKHLFRIGLGPRIIYTGIEEEYQNELLYLEDIKYSIEEKKNLINFLTLYNNDFSKIDSESSKLILDNTKGIEKAVSSEVLLSRPDIEKAEFNIKSANADIGVARAMFYPQIGLTTNVGLRSNELSNLFSSDSFGWNFSPFIKLPLFNGGRLQANLEYSKKEQELKIAEYQKTVQNAFMEVNNILKFKEKNERKIKINSISLEEITENHKLNVYNHKLGLLGKSDVLLTERQLLKSELTRLELIKNKIMNNIDFYKSIGGSINHQ